MVISKCERRKRVGWKRLGALTGHGRASSKSGEAGCAALRSSARPELAGTRAERFKEPMSGIPRGVRG